MTIYNIDDYFDTELSSYILVIIMSSMDGELELLNAAVLGNYDEYDKIMIKLKQMYADRVGKIIPGKISGIKHGELLKLLKTGDIIKVGKFQFVWNGTKCENDKPEVPSKFVEYLYAPTCPKK